MRGSPSDHPVPGGYTRRNRTASERHIMLIIGSSTGRGVLVAVSVTAAARSCGRPADGATYLEPLSVRLGETAGSLEFLVRARGDAD